MNINVRTLYLYLFSFVGLLIMVIGCIRLVNLFLKTYVFTSADRYYMSRPVIAKPEGAPVEGMPTEEEMQKEQEFSIAANRQREMADSLAMILVGLPLYGYHWHMVQKEKRDK